MPKSKTLKAPEALKLMLEKYSLETPQDYAYAVKEIVQELTLLGLWRSKFFEKAAFYGGTALRILYSLDRFSEDLDFSLLKPDNTFNLSHYERAVQQELNAFGFTAQVKKKRKNHESAVDSAFIKLNTIQHLLHIGMPSDLDHGFHQNEMLKIRFEVDTDPPKGEFETESSTMLLPSPFSVRVFTLDNLFAGKVHATLCREWQGRVKGRDWYDLIWFIAKGVRLNLSHLEARMRQSSYWNSEKALTHADVLELFETKIAKLDITSAKDDIINFIDDSSKLDLWSKDFFLSLIQKINS